MKLRVERKQVPVDPNRTSKSTPRDVVPPSRPAGGCRGSGSSIHNRSNAPGNDVQAPQRVNRYRHDSGGSNPEPKANQPRENPYSRKHRKPDGPSAASSDYAPAENSRTAKSSPLDTSTGDIAGDDSPVRKPALWGLLACLWIGGLLVACCLV